MLGTCPEHAGCEVPRTGPPPTTPAPSGSLPPCELNGAAAAPPGPRAPVAATDRASSVQASRPQRLLFPLRHESVRKGTEANDRRSGLLLVVAPTCRADRRAFRRLVPKR